MRLLECDILKNLTFLKTYTDEKDMFFLIWISYFFKFRVFENLEFFENLDFFLKIYLFIHLFFFFFEFLKKFKFFEKIRVFFKNLVSGNI